MTTPRAPRTLLLALALAVVPAALSAQQKPSRTTRPSAPRPPAAVESAARDPQAWIMELQELHERLETLQAQALRDPALASAQEELGGSIKAAMQKIDPALQEGLTRMQELESEVAAAQKTQDATRIQQLAAEAQQIERQFAVAQQKALQQPAIAAKMTAFQARLQERMTAADASAPRLLARFEELQERLAQVVGTGRE